MRRIKKLTNEQLGRTNPVIEREELRLYLGGTGPYNDQDTINFQTAVISSTDSLVRDLIDKLRTIPDSLDLRTVSGCYSNGSFNKQNIPVTIGNRTIYVNVDGHVYPDHPSIPTTPNVSSAVDNINNTETYKWNSGISLPSLFIKMSLADSEVFENLLNAY